MTDEHGDEISVPRRVSWSTIQGAGYFFAAVFVTGAFWQQNHAMSDDVLRLQALVDSREAIISQQASKLAVLESTQLEQDRRLNAIDSRFSAVEADIREHRLADDEHLKAILRGK